MLLNHIWHMSHIQEDFDQDWTMLLLIPSSWHIHHIPVVLNTSTYFLCPQYDALPSVWLVALTAVLVVQLPILGYFFRCANCQKFGFLLSWVGWLEKFYGMPIIGSWNMGIFSDRGYLDSRSRCLDVKSVCFPLIIEQISSFSWKTSWVLRFSEAGCLYFDAQTLNEVPSINNSIWRN